MTTIALDPSSMRIGYAVFTGRKLTDAGVIKPDRDRDEPLVRTRTMTADVMELLTDHPGAAVVIECGTKVSGSNPKASSGIGTMCLSIGYLLSRVELLMGHSNVHVIAPKDWTGGKKKQARTKLIAAAHKSYDATKDKGQDMADAIGLGEWWLAETIATAPIL